MRLDKTPDRLLIAGLVMLVLANFSMRFVHPGPLLPEDLVDGGNGLLMGLAIGLMLLSVVRRRRGN